jgi:hypothetical protein
MRGTTKRMNRLQRVTFRFGGDTEIHYVAQAPEPGERVTHGRELWLVARVEEDAVGTLVMCEQLTEARVPSDTE